MLLKFSILMLSLFAVNVAVSFGKQTFLVLGCNDFGLLTTKQKVVPVSLEMTSCLGRPIRADYQQAKHCPFGI